MLIRKISILCGICIVALVLTTCDNQGVQPVQDDGNDSSIHAMGKANKTNAANDSDEINLAVLMDGINAQLLERDLNYLVYQAEYITAAESQEIGTTIIAKDVGNKQLGADFVPNDTRRGWSGPAGGSTDDITYAIDQTGDAVPLFGGLTGAETTAAIQNAMTTWDDQTCSDLALLQNPDFGLDIGLVAFDFSGGAVGSPFVFADVQHAGWRDLDFAGGVLGVTFTFIFIDGDGNPTDIDNNGKADAAFREIYYDPSWSWANDGSTNVDVETVALHEAGHGLSQAHFGKVFITNKNGKVHFAPRAVMNAVYASPQQSLLGTDNGGHCSNWAEWPNN